MFSADQIFAFFVYLAFPAVLLYPLIYGLTTRWWKSWIGRALLVKAVGVLILVSFSVLFQLFGPHYFARDTVRITGMIVADVGFYLALAAMLKAKADGVRERRSNPPHPYRRATDPAR